MAYAPRRARCPKCNRQVSVKQDGTLGKHRTRAKQTHAWGTPPRPPAPFCDGEGMAPSLGD